MIVSTPVLTQIISYVNNNSRKEVQEQETFKKSNFCVTEMPRNKKVGIAVAYKKISLKIYPKKFVIQKW